MQKKITAGAWEPENTEWSLLQGSPLKRLCSLMQSLSVDFQMKPQFILPQNTCDLWVLFPGSGLSGSTFFESYGMQLAALAEHYTIFTCGSCQSSEEGELHVELSAPESESGSESEDGRETRRPLCSKKNVTGRDFDLLFSVCVKITFQNCKEKLFVHEVLGSMEPGRRAVAVNARWADVFSQEGLFEPMDFSYFRYIQFYPAENPQAEWMEALSLIQMRELWVRFLTHRQDTVEFELLYSQMEEQPQRRLYELGLALQWALLDLQIRVDHTDGQFQVIDGDGVHLRFDFGSRCAAEKLFLKLIFPVKI